MCGAILGDINLGFEIQDGVLLKYHGKEAEVTIPPGVRSIGENAFENCTTLENITIPEDVISIGEYAFLNCRSLANITIPASVVSIGNGAFVNCMALPVKLQKSINKRFDVRTPDDEDTPFGLFGVQFKQEENQ